MPILKHRPYYLRLKKGRIGWEAHDVHLIDDNLAGDVIILSVPPPGKCKILNVYWDPDTEKAVFEYEDVPVE